MKVKDSRDLSQCGCDTCVMKTRHLTACRRAQTSRMLCLCLLVYVMYVVSQLSHIGLESVLVVIHFCVAILFVNCCIRRCSLYRLRCLPRRGLLAWYCHCCCRRCFGIIWRMDVNSWNRSHQDGFTVTANLQWSSSRDWRRFPRIPNHGAQESGVPTSSSHSASRCTASNHAIRCSDQVNICFAVTPEPHTFEPC